MTKPWMCGGGCRESNPGNMATAASPKGGCVWSVAETPVARAHSARTPHGEGQPRSGVYEDEVYLVTALVPSDTACLASSPGRARRTAVWISREVRVPFLL